MGMLLSGCFAMRTLTFTDDTVDAGKKTTAKISVSGDTETNMMAMRGELDERPFFFTVSDLGSKAANGGSFDTKGVFDGPVPPRPTPPSSTRPGTHASRSARPRRDPATQPQR